MSTLEYNDLYLLCQDTGRYHMLVFDIVDSKKMDIKVRYEAQVKMIKLMKSMYSVIQEIQEKTGKQILVFDDDFVTYESNLPNKGFGMKVEPFLIGDTFGFTIYRDSLDKDIVMSIYEYFRTSLDIDFDFHIADGYYETNDYSEGSTKYFRGYCMDMLSNLHKTRNMDSLNQISKKLEASNQS